MVNTLQILDAKERGLRLAEVAKTERATNSKLQTVMTGMQCLSKLPPGTRDEKVSEELNLLQNQVRYCTLHSVSIQRALSV